jgi:hypothetical protein
MANTMNESTAPTVAGSALSVMDLVNQEELGSAALARLSPELAALKEEDLLPVNFEIPAGVALVLGNLGEIRAFREAIAREMVGFDLTRFDKLEAYTLALNEAHAGYKVATEPSDALDQVVAEGERLRDLLRAEANALELRGLLDGRKLREVGAGQGRKNLALDLTLLYKAMDDSWPTLEGKARVTRQELETAARIGQYIVRVVGVREQGTQAIAAATDTRSRIYTLFVRAYDDARRAIHFLRWKEGDADEIAPSLYSTRGSARRKGANTDAPARSGGGAGTAAGTGATPGAIPATGSGNASGPGTAVAATPGSGGRIPGGEPFLS